MTMAACFGLRKGGALRSNLDLVSDCHDRFFMVYFSLSRRMPRWNPVICNDFLLSNPCLFTVHGHLANSFNVLYMVEITSLYKLRALQYAINFGCKGEIVPFLALDNSVVVMCTAFFFFPGTLYFMLRCQYIARFLYK
jgi:hypothetical protein